MSFVVNHTSPKIGLMGGGPELGMFREAAPPEAAAKVCLPEKVLAPSVAAVPAILAGAIVPSVMLLLLTVPTVKLGFCPPVELMVPSPPVTDNTPPLATVGVLAVPPTRMPAPGETASTPVLAIAFPVIEIPFPGVYVPAAPVGPVMPS